MEHLPNWLKISCLFVVTLVVGVVSYHFSKPEKKIETVLDEEPSYRHSLKIGKKTLRTYRSPASVKRSEKRDSSRGQSTDSRPRFDEEMVTSESARKETSPDVSEGVAHSNNHRRERHSPIQNIPEATPKVVETTPSSGITDTFIPGMTPATTPAVPDSSAAPATSTNNTATEKIPMITGRVKPLVGVVTAFKTDFIISSAYAANTCTNPRILLFDMTNMSVLLDNPLSDSILRGETSFTFDPMSLNLEIAKPSRYLLHTHGCQTNFKRIVTSFFEPQDIDFVTTLISNIINTSSGNAVTTTTPDMIESLYDVVNDSAGGTTDMDTLYDVVDQSPTITNLFQEAFGGLPSELTDAAPDLDNVTYTTLLSEKASHAYEVVASHWNSTYQIAVEWQIDGVTVSNSPAWTYVPTANSPESQEITLKTGRKNLADNNVDTSFPYHEVSWDVSINDTYPVSAPLVALNAVMSDPSATKNLSLDLSTGILAGGIFPDCETFSHFAITENSAVPAPGDFTRVCSNGPVEALSYTVSETADGPVTLRFWSRDIAGRISSDATIGIVIDTTAPLIAFQNLQTGYSADDSHTFEWTLTEVHSSSAQNFAAELFDGTSWVSLGNVAVTDGPHSGTAFSTSVALPNVNVANAKIRLTYSDTVGNQTVAESLAFNINRPQLGSSPAAVSLGSVLNKQTSPGTNFTFTNTGIVPSKTCSLSIAGANASEFSFSTDNCSGSAIAAGGSCAMTVVATPQAEGARTASATITCGNDSYTTTLSITSDNNPPVTTNKTASTLEEAALWITLGSVTDVDGDSVSYSFPTGPASGTLDSCYVNSGDYLCKYTPDVNFTGGDSFTFLGNDGTVDSNTSTVSITVLPLNDTPSLTGPLAITTDEDTAHNFNLVAGSDVDGDTLTYVISAAPAHGTLVCPVATSVACTYTPSLNYNGTDTFTYYVTDGTLNSGSVTASITINAVNDAPMVALDQDLTTRDNFTYSFTIDSGNDVDTAAGALTYKLISGPATGTLSDCISTGAYSADRTCNYIAPVNFHGDVSFTYLVHDGALDSATTATVTITVNDQTPTTPVLTAANFVSNVVTSLSPLTLTAAGCSDISAIMIQESSTPPAAGAAGWQACSTIAGAMTFDPSVSNQQGFRTLRIYGKDPHNNISTPQLINFIYDSLAPQITIENIPTLPNNIAYPIKWRLTEASVLAAATFKLEYTLDGGATWVVEANVPVGQDGPHSSTLFSYNWNVPAGTYPNSQYRISLTDNTNLTGTALSNAFRILVDINAPNLLAGQMKINGSASPDPTPQKYVNVSLKSLDGDTNITHFCLKVNNTAPGVSDPCWRAVDAPQPGLTPSENLDLVNFPFLLGFVPGIYNVYAWTKDLSGNISTNTETNGQDVVTIEYFADTPPVISNFFVSNTPTPPNPITASEMVFDSGDPVTIKWRAVDDKGIQTTLQLFYTTDDVNYTEIASNLNNGLNNCGVIDEGGTTLDNDSTGCYLWTSPLANTQYFKVQLIVTDTANQSTSTTSLPLNSSRFKVLAGNMDPGINSSAKSAIIAAPGNPALYSLAVASDGKVFIRDAGFGLMYINPKTGIYEQLLQINGSSTGDNGPVRSATARAVYKITMDYQDRLIIWDYDRIRRVDTKTEPMQIETIIGAANNGAAGTQTTDTVTDPADLTVYPGPPDYAILQPLPNGDIYFQAGPYGTVDGGNTLRIYRGSLPTPSINSIRISGSGTADDYAGQLSMTSDTLMSYHLDFDVNTSVLNKIMAKIQRYPVGCSFFSMANIDLTSYASTPPHPPAHVSTCGDWASRTANDGYTYHVNNGIAWPVVVSRYDRTTNTNVAVLGSGGQGICIDGTPATSCRTNLSDIFVTPAGKVFFMDNGLVRVIDDSGNVQTLYGQTKTFGDYGLAQDARFNSIRYIDHGVGDDVIIYDDSEKVLREIRPNETLSQVIKLAGNGQSGAIDFTMQASMQTLNGASWNQPGTFATNPSNGNVYFPCTSGMICKLDRTTGLWELYAGQGDLGTHWLAPGAVLRSDIRLGGYTPTILANYGGKMVTGSYEWSGATNMNSALRELNEATNMSTFLAGKTELDGASGCPDGAGDQCNLASARSEGHAMTYHTGLNAWLYEQGGNVLREISGGNINTFTTMPEGVSSMVWNGTTLYYCSDAGQLKKIDFTTMVVTPLPFPSSGISCTGHNILYKGASGGKPARLVFPFRQNGLAGIGEYLSP